MSRAFQKSGEKKCYVTSSGGLELSSHGGAGANPDTVPSPLSGAVSRRCGAKHEPQLRPPEQRRETSLEFQKETRQSGHLQCAKLSLPHFLTTARGVGEVIP